MKSSHISADISHVWSGCQVTGVGLCLHSSVHKLIEIFIKLLYISMKNVRFISHRLKLHAPAGFGVVRLSRSFLSQEHWGIYSISNYAEIPTLAQGWADLILGLFTLTLEISLLSQHFDSFVKGPVFCSPRMTLIRKRRAVFFQLSTNVCSEPTMSWFHFRGQRPLQPHVSWTWYFKNTLGDFHWVWHKLTLRLFDGLIRFGQSEIKGQFNATFCESDISRTHWGNFFKFDTQVHLNSKVNQLHFRGQRLWSCTQCCEVEVI